MKTLITLSLAIFSLTFQVQAQSDTIEFNATIPTKNLSMDEVHGILMNYLALKCDNWMQVIQVRNNNTGELTLYLKQNEPFKAVPLKSIINCKRTYRLLIKPNSVNVFAQFCTSQVFFDFAFEDFNSIKRDAFRALNKTK